MKEKIKESNTKHNLIKTEQKKENHRQIENTYIGIRDKEILCL